MGTSESFRHRHTLFEGHGAVACFGITEGVAYHLRINTVQRAMHALRDCQESEERIKEGFLGGEPPRNPAPRYRSIGEYLTIVSSLQSSFEFIENAVVIVVVIFVVCDSIIVVIELTGQWVTVVDFEPVG